jgi:glycosyltransferase involved in cell wall biosynthesis
VSATKAAAPLRILAVVNLPWDARLGASRVWMELAEEWRRAGHTVEKFCLTDAFPQPATSSVVATLRTALFPHRAAAFVRKNSARFDVIDCLIGTLPFRKSAIQFHGLLVARSVGLYRLYNKFLSEAAARWPEQTQGRIAGRIFHRTLERRFRRNADVSLTTCDLLNLPNENEREALAHDSTVGAAAIVEPYGLGDRFRLALAQAAAPANERLRRQKICFIGTWSLRKGSRDWPHIVNAIHRQNPNAEFVFLGTMSDEQVVRSELGVADSRRITWLPKYDANDLPAHLADCTLALFPSYIEGFGLAVLEQLAAGLPTIAYDVPGPRQILPAELLTPAGDPAAMAARASEILALTSLEYTQLSASCAAVADRYRWSEIAAATARQYRQALDSLGK